MHRPDPACRPTGVLAFLAFLCALVLGPMPASSLAAQDEPGSRSRPGGAERPTSRPGDDELERERAESDEDDEEAEEESGTPAELPRWRRMRERPLHWEDPRPPLPEGAVWKTTESGLKYAVIEPGEGEPDVTIGDKVRVHYSAWLADSGLMWDSSYNRDTPQTVLIGTGSIEGWSEGIQLMPYGATYRFEIPPELAYGSRGYARVVPPDATLIYDIRLLPTPPKHVDADPERQQELESGLVYETLVPGDGPQVTDDNAFALHVTIYDGEGRLLQSTRNADKPLRGHVGLFKQPVINAMVRHMREGQMVRCESDAEGGFPPGDGQRLTWYLEVPEVLAKLPLPAFEIPDDSELESSESGLRWKVLRAGDPDAISPDWTDAVRVHYVGKLSDGTVFDSSFERGTSVRFRLNQVIRGWTEGITMMHPGERRVFVIPPDLAYGSEERGSIPADATLVYWVELIRVNGP